MQETRTRFDAGQQVRVRDESWVVLGTEEYDAVRVVHLRGTGDGNRDALRSVACPFDRIDPLGASTALRPSARRRVLSAAAAGLAAAAPWHDCWQAASARIVLHAWQLEPAMAAVNGATRLLLADHVGLGKTIQAALIVAELFARRLVQRVLVLTPPPLREQWAAEMRDRFNLAPAIFDRASLSATAAAMPVGINPWQTAPLIVSSIDLVKRSEVRAAIDSVAFDVLIVDEAHHITPSTDRGALVAAIAARTPWVVLVTATPHSGDEAAFAFLQRLGAARGESPVIFRRRRPTATPSHRRSRMVAVRPTAAERLLLDAVAAYLRAVKRNAGRASGATLAATVIARRASSSATAVGRTVRRRIALLAHTASPDSQPALPWEDNDAADADLDDLALATAGFADARQEIDWLDRIAVLAERAMSASSKIAILHRLLRRTSEALLVFTEYRDVAEHLAASLSDASSVAVLHGGLSPRERTAAVESFNGGRIRTLVATDAAGEGLNLHHRCRLVINLELPWSPRRLEQRVGRVDRLGQRKRVHAVHLVHHQSFEGTVVARLERRRALAMAKTKDDGGDERETRAALQRHLRLLTRPSGGSRVDHGVYSTRAAAARDPSVVMVYTSHALDGSGRVVQALTVALLVSLSCAAAPPRALPRRLVRALSADVRVQSAVRDELARQVSALPETLTAVGSVLRGRIGDCLDALQRQRTGLMWQGSLFDARAQQDADLQAAAGAGMRDHLERMRDSMTALSRVRLSEPRLVAAWRPR